MTRRSKPAIDDELIDQLLKGRKHSAALLGVRVSISERLERLVRRSLNNLDIDFHFQ
jgi:hypothetical protein